jgi:hypothetical protein
LQRLRCIFDADNPGVLVRVLANVFTAKEKAHREICKQVHLYLHNSLVMIQGVFDEVFQTKQQRFGVGNGRIYENSCTHWCEKGILKNHSVR